jgi:molybdopterin-guanine dinucleotide biosynthesis protein A
MSPPAEPGFSAVVLSGGTAARLGGVDKTQLVVDGHPVLDRVLVALGAATDVVIVGPAVATVREVRFVAEDPPSGGPIAGIAAGVAHLGKGSGTDGGADSGADGGAESSADSGAEWVLIAAGDMPGLTRDSVRRLQAATLERGEPSGAVLVDAKDVPAICALLRRTTLTAALAATLSQTPATWRSLIARLDPLHVVATERELRDLNEPADLDYWQVPSAGY